MSESSTKSSKIPTCSSICGTLLHVTSMPLPTSSHLGTYSLDFVPTNSQSGQLLMKFSEVFMKFSTWASHLMSSWTSIHHHSLSFPCRSWPSVRPLSCSTAYRSRSHCSRSARWPFRRNRRWTPTGESYRGAAGCLGSAAAALTAAAHRAAHDWLGSHRLCPGFAGQYEAPVITPPLLITYICIIFLYIFIYTNENLYN